MEKAKFEYTIYVAAPPETLWNALIDPKVTEKYWQHENISDWKVGSRWEHRASDATQSIDMVGEIIECTPPSRLVMSWALPADELLEDRHSRVAIDIEAFAGVSRCTITHDSLEPGSEMLTGITDG